MNQLLPPINALDFLFPAGSFVFMMWPFLLLAPLDRRRHILYNMTFAWCFLCIVRVFLLFNPAPNLSFQSMLIAEPLNTALFFAAGALLVFAGYVRHRRKLYKISKALRSNYVPAPSPGNFKRTDRLLEISPTEFEEVVVELLQSHGHMAKRTGTIGDHGVDVVAHTKTGQKWVVQCKRWRGTVGEPTIRDFYGVMHHEKADKGIIITSGTFTPQARAWARGKPIILLDGEQFISALQRARTRTGEVRRPSRQQNLV